MEKMIGHFKQKHKNGTHISCWLIHSTVSDLYPKKYNKKKILFAGLMPDKLAFNLIPNACFFFIEEFQTYT